MEKDGRQLPFTSSEGPIGLQNQGQSLPVQDSRTGAGPSGLLQTLGGMNRPISNLPPKKAALLHAAEMKTEFVGQGHSQSPGQGWDWPYFYPGVIPFITLTFTHLSEK